MVALFEYIRCVSFNLNFTYFNQLLNNLLTVYFSFNMFKTTVVVLHEIYD